MDAEVVVVVDVAAVAAETVVVVGVTGVDAGVGAEVVVVVDLVADPVVVPSKHSSGFGMKAKSNH